MVEMISTIEAADERMSPEKEEGNGRSRDVHADDPRRARARARAPTTLCY